MFLFPLAISLAFVMLSTGQCDEGNLQLKHVKLNPIYGNKFQGDILASFDQVKDVFGGAAAYQAKLQGRLHEEKKNGRKLGASKNSEILWQKLEGTVIVPYAFESSSFNSSARELIKKALRTIEIATNEQMLFKIRENEVDFVVFQSKNLGCYSYIGRVGIGAQEINLQDPECLVQGTIKHEIFHALGFWHEQARPDRDKYVTVLEKNIQLGYEDQFIQKDKSVIASFSSPYDYDSIMHYGAYAFGQLETSCTPTTKCMTQRKGLIRLVEKRSNCLVRANSRYLVDYYNCENFRLSDKLFTVEPFGNGNRIVWSNDDSLCLTVEPDSEGGYIRTLPLSLTRCKKESSLSKTQLFQIWGDESFDAFQIKLVGDPTLCLDYSGPFISTYYCLELLGMNISMQAFKLEPVTDPLTCKSINVNCQYIYSEDGYFSQKKTIEAPKVIGQRNDISNEDQKQLLALYQLSAFSDKPTTSPSQLPTEFPSISPSIAPITLKSKEPTDSPLDFHITSPTTTPPDLEKTSFPSALPTAYVMITSSPEEPIGLPTPSPSDSAPRESQNEQLLSSEAKTTVVLFSSLLIAGVFVLFVYFLVRKSTKQPAQPANDKPFVLESSSKTLSRV